MDKITIRFVINKLLYRDENTGFTIASMDITEHPKDVEIPTADTILGGYFNSVHPKDEFSGLGYWKDTGENGFRFNVEQSTLILPETEKGIIDFLTRFSDGVGRTTAKKIVDTFKNETFSVIIDHPERLSEVKRISEKQISSLVNSIARHKHYEKILFFLYPLGLLQHQMMEIYEDLGFAAIEIIKLNPYFLRKYDNISFKEVDFLASKLGFGKNDPKRIQAAVLEYLKYSIANRGDMYTHVESVLSRLNDFLNAYGGFSSNNVSKDEIAIAIGILVSDKKLLRDSSFGKEKILYIPFYRHIEDEIVEVVTELVKGGNLTRHNLENSIKDYEAKTGFQLDITQKEAVQMAIDNSISILSGAPGTGKTQTINAIIKCFKDINPHGIITLAAPTGRAAKRMTELTRIESKTIHRLIQLKGFGEKEEIETIEADFLIIDEASMIDAYVFMKLLEATTKQTKILIVGDYKQLPSVGPGLILRDLIDSKQIATTILTKIFRQGEGSQIIANSKKIIEGQKDILLDPSKKDFYFIETNQKRKISSLIVKSIQRLLDTGFHLRDIQVLSFLNKGDLGVVELNKLIQDEFNPKSEKKKEIEVGNQRVFRVGDKVIHTVNNYDLDVFNGEMGVISDIVETKTGTEVVVEYDDADVSYTSDDIHELSLSYAITVHKSQGSEFPVVIMPIHSSLSILNNRNVLYTGITRARERVICIGDRNEFNQGIDRADNTIRNSQIKEKLIYRKQSRVAL